MYEFWVVFVDFGLRERFMIPPASRPRCFTFPAFRSVFIDTMPFGSMVNLILGSNVISLWEWLGSAR